MDKLDPEKLENTPVDLSKPSNVVKNDVAKKVEHNAEIKNIEDKTLDVRNLATKAPLNAKLNELKNIIPNITNLATSTTLTAFKNKIPNASNLVKKTLTIIQKINEIEKKIADHDHDKYITTPEFNKLTAENFAARLAQVNLASKSDVANFVKKTDSDDKLKNLNKKLHQIKQNIY